MTSNSSILIDKSLLSRLDQGLYKIESIFALISGLAVFSLMMLAVISVTGRHTINQPLPGYVDWIEQAMPLIAAWWPDNSATGVDGTRMSRMIALLLSVHMLAK